MQKQNVLVAAQKARQSCLKKFLFYFKKGYQDEKYFEWERGYKFEAHQAFQEHLNKKQFKELLEKQKYKEISATAVRIESKTNLLFSFEKMALRDALKSSKGAKTFAMGLYNYLYGKESLKERFEKYVSIISSLPRKQTRVLTWPLVTVFGFIGDPKQHIFLKPMVTKRAAEKFKYDLLYYSKPNWDTYQSLRGFAEEIRETTHKYRPLDYIDLQSFIWVTGSEEYPDK